MKVADFGLPMVARRRWGFWLAILILPIAICDSLFAADRPNVLLIITDDQGYGDLSITGNPILKTPHTDRLAREGVWLTRFYVSPVCTPTRASLMTGRYNYRTRAIDTYIGRSMMEPQEVTLAEVLRDAGYATGIFGKWHLGDCYPMRAMDQGFDESLVHKGGGLRQPSNPPDGDSYFDPILWHNGTPVRKEGYCTDIFFDAAMEFVETRHKSGQPFFAYIATNAPHDPFDEVPQDKYEHYKSLARDDREARIYAMVANIDDNIGRLLKKLDDLRIADDTLVIYLHDNGAARPPSHTAGLRGTKGSVYEGGIRSPFFARWPAKFPAGKKSGAPAAHIDVMPTILDLCGIAPPQGIKFDGKSLKPLLDAAADVVSPSRTLFLQWHRGDVPALYHGFAAVTRDWKLLHSTNAGLETFAGEPKFELYDLRNDPGEQHNLAAEQPQIGSDLRKQYEAWFADVSSTRPDNYAPPRIVVGHGDTSPVVLTPQDIRSSGEGRGWDVRGAWLIRVAEPRVYTVRFRLRGPFPQPARAMLKIDGVERTADLAAGDTQCVFTDIPLTAGDVALAATTVQEKDGKSILANVFQVDVLW